MHEVQVFQAGRHRRPYILLQIDLDMIGFSLLEWRNFSHRGVFL